MKLWSEVAHPTSSWTQRADRNRPGVRPVRVRATPPCERTCSKVKKKVSSFRELSTERRSVAPGAE